MIHLEASSATNMAVRPGGPTDPLKFEHNAAWNRWVGQLPHWKHAVARTLLDDLVSEAVHISHLRRFRAVRAALLSVGLEPALALHIYDLSRDVVSPLCAKRDMQAHKTEQIGQALTRSLPFHTGPSTETLILAAKREAAALQARQHALAGTSEAVPDALDHNNTAHNSDSDRGSEPDWNDSDSEFVPKWDDTADQDWGDTPVQDAPGYAGATETDCGPSDSAACEAVNAV